MSGSGFSCIAMKRQAQEEIYEETQHMTPDELVAYFHQRVRRGPFGALWKQHEQFVLPPESGAGGAASSSPVE
jgi:hypothetical protein